MEKAQGSKLIRRGQMELNVRIANGVSKGNALKSPTAKSK